MNTPQREILALLALFSATFILFEWGRRIRLACHESDALGIGTGYVNRTLLGLSGVLIALLIAQLQPSFNVDGGQPAVELRYKGQAHFIQRERNFAVESAFNLEHPDLSNGCTHASFVKAGEIGRLRMVDSHCDGTITHAESTDPYLIGLEAAAFHASSNHPYDNVVFTLPEWSDPTIPSPLILLVVAGLVSALLIGYCGVDRDFRTRFHALVIMYGALMINALPFW